MVDQVQQIVATLPELLERSDEGASMAIPSANTKSATIMIAE